MTTKISAEQTYTMPSRAERLWAAITTAARLAEWFAPADIEPVVGRRFMIRLGADGVPDQITGQVTGVVTEERLDMLWQVGESSILVSWQVKPISGGCALRVVRGAVDDRTTDQALEVALQARVEQLRTYLRNALLSRVALVPMSGSSVTPSVPVRPLTMPLPRTPPVPPDGGDDSRRRAVLIGGGGLVGLLVGLLLVWWWWPTAASVITTAQTPPGMDTTIGGPLARTDSPAGLSSGPDQPGGGAGPTTGVTPLLPPPAGGSGPVPPLGITYVVTDRAAMSYTVTVTLANPAGAAQTWSNAGVQLTGTRMGVAVVQGPVTHHQAGQVACFNPTDSAGTIPGHGSVVFTFRVSSVVLLAGSPGTAIINATAC